MAEQHINAGGDAAEKPRPHPDGKTIVRRYLPWVPRLIGPVLLVIFLLSSDTQQLVAILGKADPWLIGVALLYMYPFLLVKSWRWRNILLNLGLDVPLPTALKLYLVGVYLGGVTPGQVGDLAKAWHLRSRGHPFAPAALSVVVDRLFDMVLMVLLAIPGVLFLGHLLPSRELQTALVVAVGAGLILLLVFLMSRPQRRWLLLHALPAILPARLHASLERLHTQLAALAMHPRLVLLASTISLLSIGFTFFRLWLLFLALNMPIPFYLVVSVTTLVSMLQLLPVSIAGVGVRDALLIGVLLPYGYSVEQALGVSALFLLLTVQHILGGFLVSLWRPIAAKPHNQEERPEVAPERSPDVPTC